MLPYTALKNEKTLRSMEKNFMHRIINRTLFYILLVVMLISAFLGMQFFMGNFHPIVVGEAYRSAQPKTGDIARYQKEYGIKSILNLRGENRGTDWYDMETREAKESGVAYLNFRMKAEHELPREQVLELIAVMRSAPKPMIIHCESGADRTGLAAALYLAAITKTNEAAAERQLSLRYGHLPFYINHAYAMDRTFTRLKPEFGF